MIYEFFMPHFSLHLSCRVAVGRDDCPDGLWVLLVLLLMDGLRGVELYLGRLALALVILPALAQLGQRDEAGVLGKKMANRSVMLYGGPNYRRIKVIVLN